MRQLKITKSITNRESQSLDKYLQDIGKEDLITAEEEVELAQKINDLMEDKILKHPAEYLWSHRRFKSTLGKNFYK